MPPQEKMSETTTPPSSPLPITGYSNAAYHNDEVPCPKTLPPLEDVETKQAPEIVTVCDAPFEFDDLLPYIGEFGLYQKILFFLMIPYAFFVAWIYFTQIFITIVPEQHWCWVPELQNLTSLERKALAIPEGADGFSKCHMYDINYAEMVEGYQNTDGGAPFRADPNWPVSACKHGWEYNHTELPYTSIATENNWVCSNSALPHTAQSIFFCGAILGGLLFGWIADRFGRIPALVGTNLVGFFGGMATALCSSFWTFCICRFLVGMAFDNCFTMMYILVLEYVGPKWRTFVANMSIAIFFTAASVMLPWIAYYVADWKLLCYITSAPLALAIFTPMLVPESARWLVSQGHFDKAIEILRKFQQINGSQVSNEIYNKFRESCVRTQKEEELDKSYTVLDLFRTPRLRKNALLLIVMWMAVSLVFDGHVRNVGSLGLDIFLTFTVACATELPADTLLTMVLDVWGRRWLACGTMVLSGIFSLLATTVPFGVPSATLAIIGRFLVNISYNIGLQYAAELLPTVVRAQGVALIHIMGYVASILAPFVVYLSTVSTSLPLIILGSLGIFGGFLALFLPETLDHELPQTLKDGENFGKGQKILEFPCIGGNDEEQCGTYRQSSFRTSFRAGARTSIVTGSLRKKVAENGLV